MFASGSAELSANAAGQLGGVLRFAARYPTSVLAIRGHTDADGTPAFNARLSLLRAQGVANWFAESGIGRSQILAEGFGESSPTCRNKDDACKAANRRVEIAVRYEK